MAKKIAATIERVLNKKVEPISMRCGNETGTKHQGHQASQEKAKNNTEENEGGMISKENQVINQESDGVNTFDTVSTRLPKILRRQPLTKNNDFLWTMSIKEKQGE
jgi:chromatin remodeling complex protein RSC6